MSEKITVDLKNKEEAIPKVLHFMDSNRWEAAKVCVDKMQELHSDDIRIQSMGKLIELYESKKVDNKILVEHQKSLQKIYPNKKDYTLWHKLYLKLMQPQAILDREYPEEEKQKVISHMSDLWLKMAKSLSSQKRYFESEALYRKVLKYYPDNVQIQMNLGINIFAQNRYGEAKRIFLEILPKLKDDDNVYMYLGCVEHKLKHYEKALEYFLRAIELNPDKALHYKNCATLYFDMHDTKNSIKYYKKLLETNESSDKDRGHLGMLQLMTGDFKEGFKNYESRMNFDGDFSKYSLLKKYPKAHWTRKNFDGKSLLIVSEQGLGDVIFALRYIPLLLERNVEVTLLIKECLHELVAIQYPQVKIISKLDSEDCNGYIHIMSLPKLFDTTVETIPQNIPYLKSSKELSQKWGKIIQSNNLKVGICWFGGKAFQYDADRSMKLADLLPLFDVKGIDWYSLQIGGEEEIEELNLTDKIVNLENSLNSFAETAGAMSNLDLIISVDTSVVHLAGAMGKPIWTLNRFLPDWRWMLEGETNAWYPTMFLFRQDERRTWEPVVQAVASKLENYSKSEHSVMKKAFGTLS